MLPPPGPIFQTSHIHHIPPADSQQLLGLLCQRKSLHQEFRTIVLNFTRPLNPWLFVSSLRSFKMPYALSIPPSLPSEVYSYHENGRTEEVPSDARKPSPGLRLDEVASSVSTPRSGATKLRKSIYLTVDHYPEGSANSITFGSDLRDRGADCMPRGIRWLGSTYCDGS